MGAGPSRAQDPPTVAPPPSMQRWGQINQQVTTMAAERELHRDLGENIKERHRYIAQAVQGLSLTSAPPHLKDVIAAVLQDTGVAQVTARPQQTRTVSGGDVETEAKAEHEADIEADADIEAEAEVAADADIEPEAEAEADADIEAETGAEAKTDHEAEVEAALGSAVLDDPGDGDAAPEPPLANAFPRVMQPPLATPAPVMGTVDAPGLSSTPRDPPAAPVAPHSLYPPQHDTTSHTRRRKRDDEDDNEADADDTNEDPEEQAREHKRLRTDNRTATGEHDDAQAAASAAAAVVAAARPPLHAPAEMTPQVRATQRRAGALHPQLSPEQEAVLLSVLRDFKKANACRVNVTKTVTHAAELRLVAKQLDVPADLNKALKSLRKATFPAPPHPPCVPVPGTA